MPMIVTILSVQLLPINLILEFSIIFCFILQFKNVALELIDGNLQT